MTWLKFFSFVLLTTALSSCSTPTQKVEEGQEEFFEKDATVCFNKLCQKGWLVAPISQKYDISITNPVGDHDYLVFETCHNKIKFEDKKEKFDFPYTPDPRFELRGKCLYKFASFNDKQKDAFAVVALDDPYYKLHAKTRCANHGLRNFRGVSVCMTSAGKDTSIEFAEPVLVEAPARCDFGEFLDDKTFLYKPTPGLCPLSFISVATGEFHVHYVIGTVDMRVEK